MERSTFLCAPISTGPLAQHFRGLARAFGGRRITGLNALFQIPWAGSAACVKSQGIPTLADFSPSVAYNGGLRADKERGGR
jgi:hypothetical protein